MDDSYILVTGATSGIGGAIIKRLSETHNLILHGRNETKLNAALEACAPGRHLLWTYDLEHVDTLQVDFERFVHDSGVAISGFVHSAGVVVMPAIKTFDLKMIRHVMDINAVSAMLLTSSLLKARVAGHTMKSLVYISSVTGMVGTRGKSLYGTSKGMLNAFVKSAAVELADKRIRINSVCPAAVNTEMAAEILSNPKLAAAIQARHPLGLGEPKDVVGIVSFLLSDDASWITGQNIVVDGGALCDLTFR